MSTRAPLVLPQYGKFDNHLSASATIKGKFEFSGTALVEGIIYGDVEGFGKSTDSVTITNNGKVFGSIRCKSVAISGAVVGNIYASNINLEANSIVQGDVYYETIGIDSQAVINGRLIQTASLEVKAEQLPMLATNVNQQNDQWTLEDISITNSNYDSTQQINSSENRANIQENFQANTYTPKRVWGKKL